MDPIPDDDDDPDGGNVLGETFVAGQLVDGVTVVIWNCATLFGTRPLTSSHRKRHIRKINKVGQLASKYGVVMLQEIHCRVDDLSELTRMLPRHGIFGSFYANKNAGAVVVVVVVSPSLLGRFGSSCVAREIVGGRAMVVERIGRALHPLALCCVHALPEWGKVAKCNFSERVRASTPSGGGLLDPRR